METSLTSEAQHRHLVGTTIPFSTTAHNFQGLFLNALNAGLAREGSNERVKSLDTLHLHFNQESIQNVYRIFYDYLGSPDFSKVFSIYIEDVVAPLFHEPILYQRKPSIRIHLPTTLTVHYHTDEWYGHGPEVYNFWLPVTDAYETNSLYLASLTDSLSAAQDLEHRKATLPEIKTRLAKISHPLAMTFWHLAIFNSKCVHGTERNQTDHTRVSMDFRILLEGKDPGSKPLLKYFRRIEESDDSNNEESSEQFENLRASAYVYSHHGFTQFIDHASQRAVIAEFARTQKISVLAEETEIKTMPHHPQLLSLVEDAELHQLNAVVLFSVLCLPADPSDRQRIYTSALRGRVPLFFANEKLHIANDARDVEKVEAAYNAIVARVC